MTYRVFIVEDDFRVAEINKDLVSKIEGFTVDGIAHTAAETLQILETSEPLPHLLLLDVYIPDVLGLDLMWNIRTKYPSIEIIMLTAANEVETIEEALRGGILDYLLKPIQFDRLKHALLTFQKKKSLLKNKKEINQEDIDQVLGLPQTPSGSKELKSPPKGIDQLTLQKILTVLKDMGTNGVTAVEVSREVGTSRSTARRYLEYLVQTNSIHTELKYGDVGRPERLYLFS